MLVLIIIVVFIQFYYYDVIDLEPEETFELVDKSDIDDVRCYVSYRVCMSVCLYKQHVSAS